MAKKKNEEKKIWTSEQLIERLKARYPMENGWALVQQVRDSTGFANDERSGRLVDALVFNLWPSRGLTLFGFEVKVSRHDWKRELKDETKAGVFMQFCQHWFLVAPDDVAMPEEIPATWGWIVPWGDSLKAKKEAPVLKPKPYDRPFVHALVRRLLQDTHKDIAREADKLERERSGSEMARLRNEFSASQEALGEANKKYNDLVMQLGFNQHSRSEKVQNTIKLAQNAKRFKEHLESITTENWRFMNSVNHLKDTLGDVQKEWEALVKIAADIDLEEGEKKEPEASVVTTETMVPAGQPVDASGKPLPMPTGWDT